MPETSSIAVVFLKIRGFFATDYGFGSVRAIFLTEKAGQEASDVHPMGKMVRKAAYKRA